MNQAHIIKELRFHEKYISIDWDTLKSAVKISIPYGIANVFFEPVDKAKYKMGMWFAIVPADIDKFIFQKDIAKEVGEIFLLTNNKKVSLGITDEAEIAQKWVLIANQIIEGAKSNAKGTA